ncbi:MAG: DUF4383 domain-containing protein [Chlamydiota bacterium]
MLKIIAMVFGVIFFLIGVLGFFPALTPNGELLGIFHVNAAHNMVHLATGIISFWVGITSGHAAKIFFQIFGVIYGLVAILGFFYGDQPIFGLIANNMADAWLHVAVSAIALYLGFGMKQKSHHPH